MSRELAVMPNNVSSVVEEIKHSLTWLKQSKTFSADSLRENILSFRVKNDLLIASGHLARDHKRSGIALTT